MAGELVGLSGVGKRYARGRRWVLHDVDLQVRGASAIALRGPNGSGKSTLLRLLAGVTVPSRGLRRADRRMSIGYAPQVLAPAPGFDVGAYLHHHARMRRVGPSLAWGLIEQLADRLGFESMMSDRLTTLSTGSLQKVVVAQALLGSPELVVLDEPLAGLDRDARRALSALIGERAQAGAAIVFSDHSEGGARPPADIVWRLADGRVHGEQP
jgi:ABC-2 type transport system ATP-binding protein